MVARATRHLTGWTPVSLSNTAPLTLRLPVGILKGRAPRFEDADVDAVGTPSSRLDAAPKPRCPTFARSGAGMRCCAAFPRCTTGAGVGARFRLGEKSFAVPPAVNLSVDLAQLTDPVGWVRLTGRRQALPHVLRRGSRKSISNFQSHVKCV